MQTEQSRCLTCPKLNSHSDIMGHAEAVQHKDHYPEHRVQAVTEEDAVEESKTVQKLAPAIVIPRSLSSLMVATGGLAYVSRELFGSAFEARLLYPIEDFDIVWPATHDADGFYSVSE